MVSKMLGPNAVSAMHSRGGGVGHADIVTLAPRGENGGREPRKTEEDRDAKAAAAAAEKLRIVIEAGKLDEAALGELLQREGLHAADLQHFREEALAGLAAKSSRAGKSAQAKRIKELECELTRKEKALAEAAALLMLRKLNALWGEAEDEDTDETKG